MADDKNHRAKAWDEARALQELILKKSKQRNLTAYAISGLARSFVSLEMLRRQIRGKRKPKPKEPGRTSLTLTPRPALPAPEPAPSPQDSITQDALGKPGDSKGGMAEVVKPKEANPVQTGGAESTESGASV